MTGARCPLCYLTPEWRRTLYGLNGSDPCWSRFCPLLRDDVASGEVWPEENGDDDAA